MKKTLKIFAIMAAICALLAITAFAANFEHCGDALNELGLFKGTQNGYELDREPTRAEAAVVLARLLGGEEEALSLSYTAPFADVPDWVKPYVQFLYDKGITKGTSETSFGATELCTAQQYATFLLRVLGYNDNTNGDFRYMDADWDAWEIGIYDGANYPWYGFSRGNMVAMTYTALSLPVKSFTAASGGVILLEKLSDESKIKGADKLLRTFEDYQRFEGALSDFVDAKKVSATAITETFGEDTIGYGKMHQETSYVFEKNAENPEKNKLELEVNERFERKNHSWTYPDIQESSGRLWYKDGYMYYTGDRYIHYGDTSDKEGEERTFDFAETQMPDLDKYRNICLCDFASGERVEADSNVTEYRIEKYDGETITAEICNGKLVSVKAEGKSKSGWYTISIEDIKTDNTVMVRFPADIHMYEVTSHDPAGWGDFEKAKESGELLIGITMKEPFNYMDEKTNELTGFETDFAVEVCERLGLDPVFLEIDWEEWMFYLWNNKLDCIWNGLMISDDKSTIHYSDAYLRNKLVLLVREEDAEKYSESASGAKIIDSGMNFFEKDIKNEYLEECKMITYGEGLEKDVLALKKNEADMVLAEREEAEVFLKKSEASGIVILPEKIFYSEEYGIAFRDESDLIPEINKVIEEMQKDGTLSEIARKYNLEQMLAK
ncbi:MAG: transporter substrate-binding domain-containing protein [Oscillospiraceae bacterium]|nr:transporter substrate-binding domain-containing protein [Oscillospiraceae bacterium]